MFDKILNKLGIYDLIGVIYTGVVIVAISLLLNKLLCFTELRFEDNKINDTFLFFVISYFVGIVFQEIGSFLVRHIIFRNSKLLLNAFNTKDNDPYLMSEKEMTCLKNKIIEENTNDKGNLDPLYIYNHCRYFCEKNCDITKVDREQSNAAMSRSFSVYFFIMGVISAIVIIIKGYTQHIWLIPILFSLGIIMFARFKRFTINRYVRILRIYLHQNSNAQE